MRGSLKQRYKGSWSLILDLGYEPVIDLATGEPMKNANGTPKMKRKQKWVTFRGTRKEAETKLNDMVRAADRNEFVEPTKLTLGQWLTEWLKVMKGNCREATYVRYKGIIENSLLKSSMASLPLQKLRPSQLEAYYREATVSGSTLTLHHTILHSALRKAVKERLITSNVAVDLDGKPRRSRDKSEDAQRHAWAATEARAFLAAAKKAGTQPAALYAVALDTGMRKGELGGLRWSNVDLETGKVRVVEQVLKLGKQPVFGPLKAGRPRTIQLSAATVELLRAHKRAQAELKLKNRTHYSDHGLVFAKEWSDVRKRGEVLGQPLQLNNLGQRQFAALIKVAGVRRIKFHGLRHTCATLLLQAGEPVHVVSERLGHSKVTMTMEVYAHVLPDMQKSAAATIGAVLHG